jgi:cytochrome c-type biogenesis protein CcmH/NrfG
MSLKPKTIRRLLLLGAATLTIAIVVVGLVFVRSWQNQRRTDGLRAAGFAAYEKADYPATLDNLAPYLRRKPNDREAWIAFAKARAGLEEPEGRHLSQAAVAYRRAWTLDDKDTKTARELLKLYGQIGFHNEARDLAVTLRPADLAAATPEHADVILEEIGSRLALGTFDTTLDQLTERLLTLAPDEYRGALARGTYLAKAGRTSDAVAFANSLPDSHPGDPRFEFARLISLADAGKAPDPAEFLAGLTKVAGLKADAPARAAEPTYTDPEFAFRVASAFDRVKLHSHALLVLQDAAQRLKHPVARRIAARRAWQFGLSGALLAEHPNPDLAEKGEHSETLGFLALALLDSGREADVAPIIAALNARKRDFAAGAWAGALSSISGANDPKARLEQLESALKESPGEPVFLFFKANALLTLARPEEAREVWISAGNSPLSVGWAAPAVRIADTLLDEGRLDDGLRAARAAIDKNPAAPGALLVSLRSQADAIEAGRPVPDKAATLRLVTDTADRLRGTSPDPASARLADRLLLPTEVILLAELNRRSDAIDKVKSALAQPDVFTPELARRLARASIRTGLGLEDQILNAVPAAPGSGSGTLVERAILLDRKGDRAGAIRLLDDALRAAPEQEKAEFTAARAQFLDSINAPEALASWGAAIDAFPQSIPLRVAALQSRAIAADSALIEKIASQLAQLGASDPARPSAEIRFARARALLHGSPTSRARDEALALLRTLALESPSRLDVRDALVDALLVDRPNAGIRPDVPAAIEQLTAAAAVARDRSPYTLRLADLLIRTGRPADAIAQLGPLSLDAAADQNARLQAVDRLISLNELDPALRGINSILAPMLERTQTPPAALMIRRAALEAAVGRSPEAVASYRLAASMTLTDPDEIVAVAAGLRDLRDSAGADSTIAKLDQPEIPPVKRSLARARFLATGDRPEDAAAEFDSATKLDPLNRDAWATFARFRLSRTEFKEAEAVARAGLAAIPDHNELPSILQQAILATRDDASSDLNALADAFAKNPATANRAAPLRALAKLRDEGKLDDPAAINGIAADFPNDAATQLYAARRLVRFTPPRLSDAVPILRRATTTFPNDPALHEEAARAFLAAGEGESALIAARRWKSLSRDRSADIAIADSLLALNRPRPAADAVAGFVVPSSIEESDALSLAVLNIRAQADVLQQQPAKALELLKPHLKSSPLVRSRIALPIPAERLARAEDVKAWLAAISSETPADAAAEQLDIARAWGRAATRLPAARTEFLAAALQIADRLAADPTPTFEVFALQVAIHRSNGDLDAAIRAGRAALAQSPNSAPALNGLAELLLQTNADPKEAISLATRARDLTPKQPQPLFALARAHAAAARAAATDPKAQSAAIEESRAALRQLVALTPSDPDACSNIAYFAEVIGDLQVAAETYDKILTLNPPDRTRAIASNNLAYILYTQSKAVASPEKLTRARSLLQDAIRVQELSDFHETLGLVEAARGDNSAAIQAYRRAIVLNPKSVAGPAGLASLLASGSEADRTEAAALIRAIDADPAASRALSPARRAALDAARASLGVK